jgi:N-methylhydantoinase A/oxoprolinase/acetone carboxylase beta subunit
MRGAAFLGKRDEALVIDVGGTTTDIGSLRHGFPREANNVVGEVDQIFQDLTRDEAIARARRAAEDKAVAAGADRATLSVVEVEDLPLAYLPGNSLRTRVRVGGEIAR